MDFIIVSDIHNAYKSFYELIESQSFDGVIFLGDGLSNFLKALENLEKKVKDVFFIEGNCDYIYPRQGYKIVKIDNLTLFITHGDAFRVKAGLYNLEAFVKSLSLNIDIVAFGHTHEKFHISKEGIEYFNPGAFSEGKYGVLHTEKEGFYIEECIFNKIKV